MHTKYGFTKMTIAEYGPWLNQQRLGRTILKIQQHHTWNPNYALFNGINHFERQRAMKNHHVAHNGWQDIGQHFTIFPDGTILTGRSLEKTPACIFGQNAGSVCIENFGNFDHGGDIMRPEQRDSIVQVTALLCKKFNLPINEFSIIYHHWFDLATGERNYASVNKKSCPGSNFFGGNKVSDCINNFLPLVSQALGNYHPGDSTNHVNKYVVVTASRLNIRQGPSTSFPTASDRSPIERGSIIRVYEENGDWLKISNSKSHWIYGRFTRGVIRATINAQVLRVRNGPGTNFAILGTLPKGEEVFVLEEMNDWCKIDFDEKWLSRDFLDFH
jgi:uncharacterized protein YraI